MDSTSADQLNVAGRLERLPLSRFHLFACSIIGAAMFFDGYDLALTGLVMPSLVKVGILTESGRASLVSLSILAAALGSALGGAIGDRYGRRRLFIANIAIFGIASPLCGVVQDHTAFLMLRMLALLTLGMQIPTGYSYLSELTPKSSRGRLQSVIALLVNGSLPTGALVAWLVMPNFPADEGWRVLCLLSALVLPLVFVPRSTLPESPRWLASVGRLIEADLRTTEIEKGLLRKGITLPVPNVLPLPIPDLGWAGLLSNDIRRRFGLAVLFQVCHLSAVSLFAAWLPTILVAQGLDAGSAFAISAISFAGGMLGPTMAIFLSDRFERRRLLVGASFFGSALGFVYPLQSAPIWLMSVGLLLTTTMFFISATGFAIYLPEILPTGIRLRGMGSAMLVGRLSSALTPFAVASGLTRFGNPLLVVTGVGLLYALLALAFAFMGPNTRGRSLETLEHSGFATQQDSNT